MNGTCNASTAIFLKREREFSKDDLKLPWNSLCATHVAFSNSLQKEIEREKESQSMLINFCINVCVTERERERARERERVALRPHKGFTSDFNFLLLDISIVIGVFLWQMMTGAFANDDHSLWD